MSQQRGIPSDLDCVVVLHVGHRKGGHCKRLYLMIQTLLERGTEVHYVAANLFQLPAHALLKPHLVRLPTRRLRGAWFWILFSIVAPIKLITVAYRCRPKIIIVIDSPFSLLSKVAALIFKLPIVLFMRSVPWRADDADRTLLTLRGLKHRVDLIGLRVATRVVSVTETMRGDLVAQVPQIAERVVVLPNSVLFPANISRALQPGCYPVEWQQFLLGFSSRKREIAERFDLADRSLILVTTGELIRGRNVEFLVRAVGAVTSDRLALIICGDGPEQARIAAVAVGLGIRDSVVFAGWLDDPVDIVAGCDLFVMPSRHEGMSNSMLEAIGAGLPVIAADTPEMRELFSSDRLLFNPDDVGALARKLEAIDSNRPELDQLRTLSQTRLQKFIFDWGSAVVSLLEKELGPKALSKARESE